MPVFVLVLHLYVTLDTAIHTVSATRTKIVAEQTATCWGSTSFPLLPHDWSLTPGVLSAHKIDEYIIEVDGYKVWSS